MPYDNNLSGLLSRNDRKQQPNHPDYQGQCEINGTQFWISAWIKEGKPGGKLAGKKFFSLSFKPKDQQQTPAATAAVADSMEVSQPLPAKAAPQATTTTTTIMKPKVENLDEDVPF